MMLEQARSLVVSAGVLAALAGCAAGPEKPPTQDGKAAWDEVAAAAARLEQSLKSPPEPAPAQPTAALALPEFAPTRPADSVEPSLAAAPMEEALIGPDPALTLADDPAASNADAEAAPSTGAAEAAAALAGDDRSLAAALKLALASALGDAGAIAKLAAIEPGLSAAQSARLSAFRTILAELIGEDEVAPADLAARIAERARLMEPARPLAVRSAALARRVEGFGKVTPIGTSKFLAGRAHPALVYVEVENFAHREHAGTLAADAWTHIDAEPAVGPGEWVVEIAQELRLYHRADGVLAWMCREQTSRDVSSRKRTDHYLVQRIALPATLTVGGYTLKVMLRDLTSGSTAEAAIPIDIVADEALTRVGSP